MDSYQRARIRMVDNQVHTNDVTSHTVLDAMRQVEREHFVAPELAELAYIDEEMAVASGSPRRLMAPAGFAKLVQLAQVGAQDIVLDIGCASGYSSAILSVLSNSVVALEEDPVLATIAMQNLADLGYDNAVVVETRLAEGYACEGPYDVIFLGGAVDEVPAALSNQLKDGGRLVTVLGTGNAASAMVYLKSGGSIVGRDAFNCSAPQLPGFQKAAEFKF